MGRKFFSFLGTNDYVEVNFFFGTEENIVRNCRFVQQALTELFCQEWNEKDKIKIFLTKEAEEKNWKTPNIYKKTGLEKTLLKINLKCKIEKVLIPEGKNEEELWEIFKIFLQNIDEKDKIIFDITHSFRSLPLLVSIVLNYAKFLKNIEVEGIYYGAAEFIGRIDRIKTTPIEKRDVPIFDLTPFVSLFDWTVGIERFLDTGDASIISKLTTTSLYSFLKTMGRKKIDEDILKIKNFATSLKNFSDNLSTSRALYIFSSTKRISESVKNVKQLDIFKFLPPILPLIEKVEGKFEQFENTDEITAQFKGVKWALEHNFIQQGFTILREFIISFVCQNCGMDYRKKEAREKVSIILNKKARPEENKVSSEVKIEPEIEKYLSANKEVIEIWGQVIQYRNDINHAGYLEGAHKPEDFKEKLEEFINRIEYFI